MLSSERGDVEEGGVGREIMLFIGKPKGRSMMISEWEECHRRSVQARRKEARQSA